MKFGLIFSCAMLFFYTLSLEAEQFSDVFKPISIKYLNELFDSANPEKQEELNHHFHIKKIYGARPDNNKYITSYSLFWKSTHTSLPQPLVNEESIHEIRTFSRATSSFYNYYVAPMIQTIKKRAQLHPKWVPRIYLAADLEFMVPHLQEQTKAEIYLMASSSIAHNPGALWRFLAFDDPQAYFVCINDSDEYINPHNESKVFSWLKDSSSKGWLRLMTLNYRENLEEALYSPLVASSLWFKNVQNLNFNMEKAMKGFILHRQLFPDEERHPRDVSYDTHPYGFGNEFPTYGFDERFLKHVVYYEMAKRGELTAFLVNKFEEVNANQILKSASAKNLVLMDIEFIRKNNLRPIYGVKLIPELWSHN